MPRDGGVDIREWWPAGRLADMGLPGLPATSRGVELLAKRQGWLAPDREGVWWRKRGGDDGWLEFHVSVLPTPAARALLVRAIDEAERTAREARRALRCLRRRLDRWGG